MMMNDDDDDEKKCSLIFWIFFWKYSLCEKNVEYFGKSGKNFFLAEKNPTSSFKIGGILGKKNVPQIS